MPTAQANNRVMFEQRLAISTGPNITSDNNSICPHSLIGTQSEIVLTVELTEPHACSGCVQTAVQSNHNRIILIVGLFLSMTFQLSFSSTAGIIRLIRLLPIDVRNRSKSEDGGGRGLNGGRHVAECNKKPELTKLNSNGRDYKF